MASSGSTLGSSSALSSSFSKKSSSIHGFFANTPGDSLEDKALLALFNQFDFNVSKILAFFLSAKNKKLEDCLDQHIPLVKRLIFRVNTLCTYIANAEKNELKDFLDANIKLLPLLLKLKTTVRSCRGHLYENCNAIEIALKAGDVGRKGCELYLVSDEEPANTTQEKLFLYGDADANAPLRYIVNDAEHTIQCGTGEDQLNPEYFNTLKAMFPNGVMNKPLYLSTDNLTDAELQAYSAILKITKERGHTEFVKEDGIVEFLKKNYFKNNDAEFEKLCQLSEEVLAQAESEEAKIKQH